jgi:hypothetical protein
MSYCCCNCGEIFAEPATWSEDGQTFSGSPCCFDSYDPVDECESCGNEFVRNEYGVCRDCLSKALERFKEHLETYTDGEIAMLERVIDGIGLEPKQLRLPHE